MASAASTLRNASSCGKMCAKKRRAPDATPTSDGHEQSSGRVPLLPALMEAARLLQYEDQYRNPGGRAGSLRASLRVTCEAYLKLVGVTQFPRDKGALRLMRLLTETHVQAQARAMEKARRRLGPRSMERRSMVQLAEMMAREYVAEVRGEEVLYTPPLPVDAFRPVKRYRVSSAGAGGGSLRGELPRVAERSAFSSVTPGTDGTDSEDSDSSLSSVISSSEACEDERGDQCRDQCEDESDGVVPESELDEYEEYEEEDDDEVCRADGNNLAQCMCYKCVLGEDGDEE